MAGALQAVYTSQRRSHPALRSACLPLPANGLSKPPTPQCGRWRPVRAARSDSLKLAAPRSTPLPVPRAEARPAAPAGSGLRSARQLEWPCARVRASAGRPASSCVARGGQGEDGIKVRRSEYLSFMTAAQSTHTASTAMGVSRPSAARSLHDPQQFGSLGDTCDARGSCVLPLRVAPCPAAHTSWRHVLRCPPRPQRRHGTS
jgi:hypothetical protein